MALVGTLCDLDGLSNELPISADIPAAATPSSASGVAAASSAAATATGLAMMGGAGEAGRHKAGQAARRHTLI